MNLNINKQVNLTDLQGREEMSLERHTSTDAEKEPV